MKVTVEVTRSEVDEALRTLNLAYRGHEPVEKALELVERLDKALRQKP